MNYNKIIMEKPNSTVVAEYISDLQRQTSYQSEAELEKSFINLLQTQAYEYLQIKNEADLISNLRIQLEKLNNYRFTDNE
jgi:type I restriction enzyme R subunit